MENQRNLLKFLTHFLGNRSLSLLFWLSLVIIGSSVFILQPNEGTKAKSKVASINIVEGATTYSKVILLSWDGAQRNHVLELLQAGRLPNLQKIISEGGWRSTVIDTADCRCTSDGVNYHPETGPAHAAMLTGYGFPKMNNHANGGKEGAEGVIDCPVYCAPSKTASQCAVELGPHEIPSGRTIFERLKTYNPNIKTGLLTGKDWAFFPFPAIRHAAPSTCCSSYSGFAQKVCGDGNSINTCKPSGNSPGTVAGLAKTFIDSNKNNPFFLFAHFRNPDEQGHSYAENSSQYAEAIIDDDKKTGSIRSQLISSGIYNQTIFLITTDHGFVEGGSTHHPCNDDDKDVWLVSSLKAAIAKQGVTAKQTSITPTILDIFGAGTSFEPSFDGDSLLSWTDQPILTPPPPTIPLPNPDSSNLFSNPSFEAEATEYTYKSSDNIQNLILNRWNFEASPQEGSSYPARATINSTYASDNTKSLLVRVGSKTPERYFAKASQLTNVANYQNQKLDFYCYVRKAQSDYASQLLIFSFFDADKNLLNAYTKTEDVNPTISQTWQKDATSFTVPPSASYLLFSILVKGKTTVFNWDDFSLTGTAITPSGTPTLPPSLSPTPTSTSTPTPTPLLTPTPPIPTSASSPTPILSPNVCSNLIERCSSVNNGQWVSYVPTNPPACDKVSLPSCPTGCTQGSATCVCRIVKSCCTIALGKEGKDCESTH